jgi:uncharacterized protein
MLRRRTRALACAFFLSLIALGAGAGEEAPLPALSGRVVDTAGALPAVSREALTQQLAAFEATKGTQLVVVIVPRVEPDTIEQFGIRLMDTWKIGRKGVDDGAILIVATEAHQLRIEVGYGLEGALSDAITHRIIDETMVPKLQAGDLAGAVTAGVTQILAVIGGENLPPPSDQHNTGARAGGGAPSFAGLGENTLLFGLGALVLIGTALRYFFGNLIGSGITGSVAGVFGWLLTGSLVGAGVAFFGGIVLALFGLDILLSGAFSGGGGGGGRSGGGGFSGGGGSGGGGGASGRW